MWVVGTSAQKINRHIKIVCDCLDFFKTWAPFPTLIPSYCTSVQPAELRNDVLFSALLLSEFPQPLSEYAVLVHLLPSLQGFSHRSNSMTHTQGLASQP